MSAEPGAGTEDEELVKPIFKNGVFESPFDTWKFPSFWDVMKMIKGATCNDTSGIPWGNQEVIYIAFKSPSHRGENLPGVPDLARLY